MTFTSQEIATIVHWANTRAVLARASVLTVELGLFVGPLGSQRSVDHAMLVTMLSQGRQLAVHVPLASTKA